MNNIIKMSSVLIFLFFSSFNTVGEDTTYERVKIKIEKVEETPVQDSLYEERIRNINRLEQIKYAVHKLGN